MNDIILQMIHTHGATFSMTYGYWVISCNDCEDCPAHSTNSCLFGNRIEEHGILLKFFEAYPEFQI